MFLGKNSKNLSILFQFMLNLYFTIIKKENFPLYLIFDQNQTINYMIIMIVKNILNIN